MSVCGCISFSKRSIYGIIEAKNGIEEEKSFIYDRQGLKSLELHVVSLLVALCYEVFDVKKRGL